ncbi:MAG: hypothetical protein U1F68_15860 [Gammaproteobacteria bacterium]
MQNLKKILTGCAVALFLPVIGGAEPLAKTGTYSGKFLWSEHDSIIEIEKDHMYLVGVQQGVFLNDAGSGFLHRAVGVCSVQGMIEKDKFTFSGYCHATDKDGDKAILQWACPPPQSGDRCVGTFDWIGGTGKYAGIQGRSQFDGVNIGKGPLGDDVGDSNWKGEWKLP